MFITFIRVAMISLTLQCTLLRFALAHRFDQLVDGVIVHGKCHNIKISSFGSLLHFKKEKKPIEAGDAKRCLSCEHAPKCPYDAKRLYLDPVVTRGSEHWPISAIVDVVDIENVTDALLNGPYGQCVYESDNDVVDHQVVNMQFENGATVAFSLVATTQSLDERKEFRAASSPRLPSTEASVRSNAAWTRERLCTPTISRRSRSPSSRRMIRGILPIRVMVDGGDFGLVYAFLNAVWKSSPRIGTAKLPLPIDNGIEANTSASVSDDHDPEAWRKYLPAPKETLNRE
ncbi:hypothetical protein BC937DRAFT_95497 [Endogone sp. FLAS-F59071]|nr:hypothetical protein BC937DRAFT_95497 [Endogone sp. FLAS-F59071]|eukprot:RUS20318.1 hypothetical protein BC937DRAFT_95497 [Endogone sp. FLAS-F59071]